MILRCKVCGTYIGGTTPHEDLDSHLLRKHPGTVFQRETPDADTLAGAVAREAVLDAFRCRCGRETPCDPCELYGELGADVKRKRVAWPV